MSDQIAVRQTGPLTFQIAAPLTEASAFVQKTLSKLEKVVLTPTSASKIKGEYKFGGGDLLVPFAFDLTQASETLILVELHFSANAQAWCTDMIREAMGKALCKTYDPAMRAPVKASSTKISGAGTVPKKPSAQKGQPAAARATVAPSSDYKTTSGLGSFFAIIGWLGVAVSIIGGLAAAQTAGFAGVAAGFIAALFCLMTVAAGQLLQAQVEVANNSRLILVHLEKLDRSRE